MLEEFKEKVKSGVESKLGEDYFVVLCETRKNNCIVKEGVRIRHCDTNVATTIYFTNECKEYENGKTLSEIVDRIIYIYKNNSYKNEIDLSIFNDYDRIKDHIFYKLCNTERNQELLNEVPSMPLLDLSIVFYIDFSDVFTDCSTAVITNQTMNVWGVDYQELTKQARENMSYRKQAEICDLFDWLIPGVDDMDEIALDERMYVVTNTEKIFGAAMITCPEVLNELTNRFKSNFFIIPSSIHEVLVIKDCLDVIDSAEWKEKIDSIRDTIEYVNNNEVAPEELLSYNLYYYDIKDKKMELI